MRLIYIALVMLAYMFGAINHESDMANNCARNGNASAWFYDISCEVNP